MQYPHNNRRHSQDPVLVHNDFGIYSNWEIRSTVSTIHTHSWGGSFTKLQIRQLRNKLFPFSLYARECSSSNWRRSLYIIPLSRLLLLCHFNLIRSIITIISAALLLTNLPQILCKFLLAWSGNHRTWCDRADDSHRHSNVVNWNVIVRSSSSSSNGQMEREIERRKCPWANTLLIFRLLTIANICKLCQPPSFRELGSLAPLIRHR